MKIVGFEANGGLRLGVVEGDQVIDLQAVDKAIPADLGGCAARATAATCRRSRISPSARRRARAGRSRA